MGKHYELLSGGSLTQWKASLPISYTCTTAPDLSYGLTNYERDYIQHNELPLAINLAQPVRLLKSPEYYPEASMLCRLGKNQRGCALSTLGPTNTHACLTCSLHTGTFSSLGKQNKCYLCYAWVLRTVPVYVRKPKKSISNNTAIIGTSTFSVLYRSSY